MGEGKCLAVKLIATLDVDQGPATSRSQSEQCRSGTRQSHGDTLACSDAETSRLLMIVKDKVISGSLFPKGWRSLDFHEVNHNHDATIPEAGALLVSSGSPTMTINHCHFLRILQNATLDDSSHLQHGALSGGSQSRPRPRGHRGPHLFRHEQH